MRNKIGNNVQDRTYFRMSNVMPRICKDTRGEFVELTTFKGTKRSWGAPGCSSTILVDDRNFLAVFVAYYHKHRGGQGYHYFTRRQGKGIKKVTAGQLSSIQRQKVLDAYKDKAPSFAKKPFLEAVSHVSPAIPESEPKTGYKVMAKKEGRYFSVYDGREYLIGQKYTQAVRKNHNGGYYVYDTEAAAKTSEFPRISAHYDTPKVIVKCRWNGQWTLYGRKRAVSSFVPVEEVND